jgi:hypothetical protein
VAAFTVALAGREVRERLLLGAVAGAVLYATTLAWLTDFSPPRLPGDGRAGNRSARRRSGPRPTGGGRWRGGWWTLPAALVLLEAVQTRVPLGGFPLPGLVHSQLDGPFALAAPLGGSLLGTGLAATGGLALAALVLLPGAVRRFATAGDVVPAIEVAAARLRAREFGLRATVPLRTGLTPYARTGDLPALALAAGSLLLATLLGRRRSGPGERSGAPTSIHGVSRRRRDAKLVELKRPSPHRVEQPRQPGTEACDRQT